MFSKNALIIEGIFIAVVFGYMAFQILRAWVMHVAKTHPSLRRALGRLYDDNDV
jgi:hypothetical protein